jgi:enamine deaminase RidA (YjgF/YER057c/UK114 family)
MRTRARTSAPIACSEGCADGARIELPASSLVRVAGLFAPGLSIELEGILALERR